jgi:LDH2 family malate/lactate/ureidoglycolate dehydrogenase
MVLGTNPISLGAPANNGDNFVLDMATTATALGKVKYCITDTPEMNIH